MQLQLLQQQLAQGAMLPGLSAALAATAPKPSVGSPGATGAHGIATQCPNPTSPVTSASIGPGVSNSLFHLTNKHQESAFVCSLCLSSA